MTDHPDFALATAPASASHGALMDAVYDRQRHIYDLTRKYYLIGRDRLIAELRPMAGQAVLEVGCGTGRNLIVAARRYPKARFFGIDISEKMLETARARIEHAGLSDRITLQRADAATFDAVRTFGHPMDRIFFSYTLSMIPPWQHALTSAAASLAPGGSIHVVDFGQQERLPLVFRRLLRAWLARFHVEPRADLLEVLDAAGKTTGRIANLRAIKRGYAWMGMVA